MSTRSHSGILFIVFVLLIGGVLLYAVNQAPQGPSQTSNNANAQTANGNTNNSNTSSAQNANNSVATTATATQPDPTVLKEEGFWIPAFTTEVQKIETGPATVYSFGGGFVNTITVIPASEPTAKRLDSGLSNPVETPITVNGFDGMEITGTSEKDGSRTTYIAVTAEDLVYFARGTSEFLNGIKTSFTLSE